MWDSKFHHPLNQQLWILEANALKLLSGVGKASVFFYYSILYLARTTPPPTNQV